MVWKAFVIYKRAVLPQQSVLTSPFFPADSFTISEQRGFTPDVIRFLETIQWGSGGTLYTQNDLAGSLGKLPSPSVFTLRKEGQLVATCMVLEKPGEQGALKTAYLSMLAVDPQERGKGYGRQIVQQAQSRMAARLGTPSLMYAYIESGNERSLRVFNGLGYQPIGRFQTVTFNRVFPRRFSQAIPLPNHALFTLTKMLQHRYRGHALGDFLFSLRAAAYYVLLDQGDIVAGLQVDPQHWQIHQLDGLGGRLALHLLPRIPLARRVFNPQEFRFLKASHIYFSLGQAGKVFELLESVLALHGLKTALMYWDPASPVYQEMSRTGRFGFLNALTQTEVQIMGLPHALSTPAVTGICEQPKVISPTNL